MRRTFFSGLALVAWLATLAACASTSRRGQATTDVEYYTAAMDEMKNEAYTEAIDAFETIKAHFPYSKYVALADLRLADIAYQRQNYIEAIDTYRNFLKYHPTHSEAPYAMFRIAESYQAQIPTDYFFLPPAAEKDQASTRMSISAYRDMLTKYPQSEYAEKAQAKLDACRRKLADHEMYVARFYYRREKYAAAAARAEGVLRDYPGLGLDAEALWIAGSSRFYTKELTEARTFLAQLEEAYQDSSEAKQARSVLEELDKKDVKVPVSKSDEKSPGIDDISTPAGVPASGVNPATLDPGAQDYESHNPDPGNVAPSP